ncbi:MAG: hypothetical protein WC836_12150 [Desulfobacula sp.]|jgi:hypothetical protein
MKTSRIGNFGSMGCRIMTGLVFVAMMCSLVAAPAMGKDDRRNNGKDDRDRYEDRGRGHDDRRYEDRRRGRDYGRYEYRGYDCYRVVRGRRVYQPCNARPPIVYTRPRVIYAPPPPVGIHIFFPPIYFPFDH